MIYLAFDQPTCDRILSGEQTVVTYPASTLWWPTTQHDEVGPRSLFLPSLCGLRVAVARLPEKMPSLYDRRDRPVYAGGAIVGSATVAAVVPTYGPRSPDEPRNLIGLEHVDLTPGRWAVILTDAAPCEQRCPWCCTTRDGYTLRDDGRAACHVCHDKTICASIPYSASGPFSEWTP